MKKILLSIFIIFLIGGIVGFALANEKLPEGSQPEKADSLAKEMLLAINDSAWQATAAVEWIFMGKREHLWDKTRNFSRVRWGKFEVIFDINKKEGVAYKNGALVNGDEAGGLIHKAWKMWVNDSFWLNPVSKAFDDGTTRTLVTTKKGEEGLMVSYSSGGDTPGDSYVWLLDENNLPYAWKMWVSIIPIGGIKVLWSDWTKTETGVLICTLHDSKVIALKLEGVKTAFKLGDLTDNVDVFEVLTQ